MRGSRLLRYGGKKVQNTYFIFAARARLGIANRQQHMEAAGFLGLNSFSQFDCTA